MKKRIAVYPGTFDPFTNGHLDLVVRGLMIFDEVIVAIAPSQKKNPLFNIEERLALIEKTLKQYDRVSYEVFEGLLVDYVKDKKGIAIIRGLRAVSDFEHEFQMAIMNRRMNREIHTVFLMTGFRWVFTSSSIIKEVARFGGDVEGMVPEPVITKLKEKYGHVS